jgi:hypothetical protein
MLSHKCTSIPQRPQNAGLIKLMIHEMCAAVLEELSPPRATFPWRWAGGIATGRLHGAGKGKKACAFSEFN